MANIKQITKLSLLIIFIIAASLYVLFVIKGKISEKAGQISQGRSMLISMDKRESNFVDLKKNYYIVKENLPLAKSFFPTIDELDEFTDRVENLASELGGTKNIGFENDFEIYGQNLKKLDFTITFSGKREFFSKFINEFDKLPYFIKIDKIEIKNAADSSSGSDMLSINASIFLKK